MNLFHDNGHFTDEGFAALLSGGLDELQSLEAAEHLSFCDSCLTRYTLLLDESTLLAPSSPQKKPVLARLRAGKTRQLAQRYGTVAAAAAIVFTVGSVTIGRGPGGQAPHDPAPRGETASFTQRANDALSGFTTGVNSFFNNLFTPGQDAPQEEAPPTPLEQYNLERQQQRADREQLFDRTGPDENDE